jgi:hypothetical protein
MDEVKLPVEPEETSGRTADVTVEEAEDYKPSGAELVVADPREPEGVFVVFDRHDEQQIIEEFQRRALKVMLYDFEQGGAKLIDLSYAGVNEAIRLMNSTGKCRIHIDKDSLRVETVTEDRGNGHEEFYVATVFATDDVTNFGEFGTSAEPKLMRLRNGKTKWDIFARTKAINKAQRNALKTMIPEALRQTIIAQYKGDATAIRQIQAGAGAESLAELPPPLNTPEAEERKAEARKIYDEIREKEPTKLLPAVFHNYMVRAEHSLERLDDFLEFLRGIREEVTE